ncbi:oligosaccharide flippase family protein [Nocardioides sp. zg-1228]|uniref:oligosaccharide flippase family protein n=1 Tax=Nocardioides sp. zg-1228 TaxID=2763008 RepID=UPI001642CE57|nr:oligosaccharide flippase family protein [Nocardioides sp. zg-1228]MBC2931419.1 oligosaccharide flippase family protein [Nocardioides sp. zg-1228]QSF57035.1 oligosaccharide flippase family protein [Nocardioides sp. zg-1228]
MSRTRGRQVLDGRAPESGRGLEARVRSGAAWGVVNNLTIRFANIAVMVVVVRLVSPEQFGVFAAALTVSVVVSGFADWGVAAYLVRGDVDPDEVGPTVTAIAILSGVVLAVLVSLSAPRLADMFGAPAAVEEIRVMSLVLVVGGVIAVPTALLAREFQQGRLFAATVAGFVPSSILLVVLATQGAGAMAFAWSRVAAIVFQGAFILVAVARVYRPRITSRHLRHVFAFGLPLAGANLVNYALVNADYALVGHQFGAAFLGVYMLAFNVSSWATAVLSGAINGVAMPGFSRVWGNRQQLSSALGRSTRAVCLVAFVIAAMTYVLAEPLIRVLYGATWDEAAPVLEILAVYGGCFALVSLLSNLLVGAGRTSRALVIQVAWLVALFPAMAIGARMDGLHGVAWAHVAVVLLVVLPAYGLAVSPLVDGLAGILGRAIVLPLACAGLAAVAAALAMRTVESPHGQLLVGAAAGGAVYTAVAGRALLDLARSGRGGGGA